jgi:hypothetical protein
MTSTLILPARLAREYADRRQSFRRDVLASIVLDDSDRLMAEFCRRLQAIDPRLMLVRARETVVPGVPMRPGYYHLLVDNGPGVPLTVTVIEGKGGEFAEPTSRIFEKLMAGDMRERRNLERFARVEAERHAAVEREKARDRHERREHLRDLVNAYTRTGVSMTDARPWTQNTQPHARSAAGEVVALDEARRKKGHAA